MLKICIGAERVTACVTPHDGGVSQLEKQTKTSIDLQLLPLPCSANFPPAPGLRDHFAYTLSYELYGKTVGRERTASFLACLHLCRNKGSESPGEVRKGHGDQKKGKEKGTISGWQDRIWSVSVV